MIIISNSIPKSGSTLFVNLQQDLLNSLEIIKGQKKIQSKYGGRFISSPKPQVLMNLFLINFFQGSFVIKCHWSSNIILDQFCKLTATKMTMTYRDPRDIILSMIDHGKRSREGKDKSNAFIDCENVIDLIPRVSIMLETLYYWRKKKYVRCYKYEDLINQPIIVLEDVVNFLGLTISLPSIHKIYENREKQKYLSWNYNTGKTQRWKTEMNDFEKQACKNAFMEYLVDLEYELL